MKKLITALSLATLMILLCACKSTPNHTDTQFPSASSTPDTLAINGSSFTPKKPPILRSTPTEEHEQRTPVAHNTPTSTLIRLLTATPVPTRKPTIAPTPTPRKTGVNGNPWNYSFDTGAYIYSPPPEFCSYFRCIPSFWSGHGYVVECQDTLYSKSGGISGSCSKHGGNKAILYSH